MKANTESRSTQIQFYNKSGLSLIYSTKNNTISSTLPVDVRGYNEADGILIQRKILYQHI